MWGTASVVAVFLTAAPLWAQSSARELERRQQELEALQRSITELRRQLDAHQRRMESLTAQLRHLRRYRLLLERSLTLTRLEIQHIDDSLQRLRSELALLSARRDTLGQYQRRLLQRFYLLWLSPGKSGLPLQPYVRAVLDHYQRHDQLLAWRSDTLARLQQRLQSLQERRNRWLQQHQEQHRELLRTIDNQERILAQLRRRRDQLQSVLRQRQSSARRLQRMIEHLAARLRQSPSRSPRLLPTLPPSAALPPTSAAPASKGSFRWPSSSRRLLRGYGLQRNPETGVAWDNPGIDIAAPQGSPVYAIAPGVVKLLQWLPTYQNVIVVEHPGGFYSVYANLQRPAVSPGATVNAGTLLGTAGSTLDGEGFHFQLWRGRQRLNPVEWLR